ERTVPDLLARIKEGPTVPPTERRSGLGQAWDAVIRRAVERLPARRFSSALEFLDALPSPEVFESSKVLLPSLYRLPPPSRAFDVVPPSAGVGAPPPSNGMEAF